MRLMDNILDNLIFIFYWHQYHCRAHLPDCRRLLRQEIRSSNIIEDATTMLPLELDHYTNVFIRFFRAFSRTSILEHMYNHLLLL
jgi:hypothetical protein